MFNAIYNQLFYLKVRRTTRHIDDHYGQQRGSYLSLVKKVLHIGALPRKLVLETIERHKSRFRIKLGLRAIDDELVGRADEAASLAIDARINLEDKLKEAGIL
jgi:hypothetical protein